VANHVLRMLVGAGYHGLRDIHLAGDEKSQIGKTGVITHLLNNILAANY